MAPHFRSSIHKRKLSNLKKSAAYCAIGLGTLFTEMASGYTAHVTLQEGLRQWEYMRLGMASEESILSGKLVEAQSLPMPSSERYREAFLTGALCVRQAVIGKNTPRPYIAKHACEVQLSDLRIARGQPAPLTRPAYLPCAPSCRQR